MGHSENKAENGFLAWNGNCIGLRDFPIAV